MSDWSSDVCSSDLAWHDCSELAVMGLAEVLRHLPRLLRLRRRLLTRLEQWQPDLYIGIDAPVFTLPVERRLTARGITTVHRSANSSVEQACVSKCQSRWSPLH